jgi:hypothetical protein
MEIVVATKSRSITAGIANEPPQVKFEKPKILLIDLDPAVCEVLQRDGWNVTRGTFGKPYRVSNRLPFEPIVINAVLSDYAEQEIVAINLDSPKPDGGPPVPGLPDGEPQFFAKTTRGVIDPRPRTMIALQEAFGRILVNGGGIFVIFGSPLIRQTTVYAKRYGHQLIEEQAIDLDLWCFLQTLSDIEVKEDHGTEIAVNDRSELAISLEKFLTDAAFTCSFKPKRSWEHCTSLATNKYGDAVALHATFKSKGAVIILPQVHDKAGILQELLRSGLPELAPHLFVEIEEARWIHQPEYELERVVQLQERKAEVARNAASQIDELDRDIETARAASGWLHDLLTTQGDALVAAVQHALGYLGFKSIIDIDAERDGQGRSRREDLQIADGSPLLVVDIKGLGGGPKDEDALQAEKHTVIRIRELKRHDIQGLTIINHQRNLPPHERQVEPFRQELVDYAAQAELGLMTTWDIYRLIRNVIRLDWQPSHVQPIFYRTGRIDAVPAHYTFIGVVAKAWTDKFGIVLEKCSIDLGDVLAVECGLFFEEIAVTSIQVNNAVRERANVGDQTGLVWPKAKPKLKEGLRVFKVRAPT